MKTIAIIAAKMAIFLGKILKRGSVLPGRIALKIDKKIMSELKLPDIIVAVTGSSGKGSTTSLVADSLREAGYTVTHNVSGSNLTDGILTSLIKDSKLNGSLKSDAVILEVDERYTKYVFPSIKPKFVVITNITRDQPPRQGNFDLVYYEIKKALNKNMHLILNADDPYLQKFALEFDNITYYSLDKNKYSTANSLFENLNLVYCPKCNSKLTYDYFHFENLGFYKCKKCKLTHPDSAFKVSSIDYKKNVITINKNKVNINSPMLFSVYNTLAVYSTLSLILNDEKEVTKLINDNTKPNLKQYNAFKEKNRFVYVLNNKNENSTTFNQSLLLLNRDSGKKTVVIGWKEISRRYKHNDISWLYDIDFELLTKHKIEYVIAVGVQKYDIATRIEIAGIDENLIKCFDTLEDASAFLKKKTKENIYAILNFDYVAPFTTLLEGDKND